ncbi:AAA family ATPase (plasmid) [Staphylococcus epidermidis]|nr:AAA family ATPase [Staphylococcus epidermidis]
MNFKTLVIDIDPQADATDTLLMTFNGNVKNSLYETFENNLNVQDCIVGLSKNLDLIPSDFNMIGFPQLLDDLGYSRTNGATILSKLINEIKYNYDYILIDTPQQ